VVIVRDMDRLTRNLTEWSAFEKACVQRGVRLGGCVCVTLRACRVCFLIGCVRA
jgi:hypothetical protein